MAFSTAGGGPFSTGPKMNVTPLIDVLLVLIIVFMLVVIEQKPVGLQTEIPQQPKTTGPSIPPPLTTIVIQIHHAKPGVEHPRVMVNEESVEWDHLRERLRDIFAIRVERIASARRAIFGNQYFGTSLTTIHQANRKGPPFTAFRSERSSPTHPTIS